MANCKKDALEFANVLAAHPDIIRGLAEGNANLLSDTIGTFKEKMAVDFIKVADT